MTTETMAPETMDATQNAYQAPEAELTETNKNSPILEMKRFSTWAVIILSIITVYFYFFYWMYSRSKKLNALSNVNKVNMTLLYIYLFMAGAATILSYFPLILGLNQLAVSLGSIVLILSIVNFVIYLFCVFSIRKVLSEVINEGNNTPVKLGGVKTFFFSVFYFQYKTNQAIDIARG